MSVADRLILITSSGAEIPLDGSYGIDARRGARGAELPPIRVDTVPRLIGGGSALGNVQWEERIYEQPLLVEPDDGDVRYVLRQLAQWTGRKPFTLRWENPDGDWRQLENVIYLAGLEGNEDDAHTGAYGTWRQMTMRVRCPDPYWYGADAEVALPTTMRTASAAQIRSSARIPSDGGGPVTIDVAGDERPDGYVELVGRFYRYSLAPADTRIQWTLDRTREVAAGQTLIVDSSVAAHGPKLTGGQIDWTWLTRESAPFQFPVGAAVDVIVGARSDAGASARYVYRPRWLTP